MENFRRKGKERILFPVILVEKFNGGLHRIFVAATVGLVAFHPSLFSRIAVGGRKVTLFPVAVKVVNIVFPARSVVVFQHAAPFFVGIIPQGSLAGRPCADLPPCIGFVEVLNLWML